MIQFTEIDGIELEVIYDYIDYEPEINYGGFYDVSMFKINGVIINNLLHGVNSFDSVNDLEEVAMYKGQNLWELYNYITWNELKGDLFPLFVEMFNEIQIK